MLFYHEMKDNETALKTCRSVATVPLKCRENSTRRSKWTSFQQWRGGSVGKGNSTILFRLKLFEWQSQIQIRFLRCHRYTPRSKTFALVVFFFLRKFALSVKFYVIFTTRYSHIVKWQKKNRQTVVALKRQLRLWMSFGKKTTFRNSSHIIERGLSTK